MESSSVLLVSEQYASSEDDGSNINREVAQILTGAGRRVYSLVLEDTEEDRKCAKADGVELILPTSSQEDPRKPCLAWLTFDHLVHYPKLPQDVGWIVGHAGVTSRAATIIMEQRFPRANLSLVTRTIPEDTEKYKEEEKAMGIGKKEESIRQDAEKANNVFSVGHRIYDHFTNTFRAIPKDKRPVHKLFLPEPSKTFQGATVEYVEGREKIVLLFSKVTEVGKLKGLDFAAKALARVVERSRERIKLRICGVSKEEYQASMKILQAYINSGKLIPTLLPQGTEQDICRDMQQAHLVLMPSRTEPFGLVGLQAMAAGVPVLISDQSGLATLVNEVVAEFHHSVLGIMGDDSVDIQQWADKIEKVLRFSEAEFSRAAQLKKKLLESRYWEESHRCLLQACGGAGSDAQQAAQDQGRDTIPSDGRTASKLDQRVKFSITVADSISFEGRTILLSKLEVMITEDVQSEEIFNERMAMYKQLKSEVMDDTVSDKGKKTLLRIINEIFTRNVLRDEGRFKETIKRLHKVKAEIRELCEGSVLCKLRFNERDSQVEFVSACKDGSLSAILTEEYISQELVEICGGMPLYVHVEVDEADFQKGTHFFEDVQVEQVTTQLASLHTARQPKDVQKLRAGSMLSTARIHSASSHRSTRTTQSTGTGLSSDTGYATSPSILSEDDRTSSPFKVTDDEDPQVNLNLLFAELNRPAVKRDKSLQFDLYCQIGDLYRTKLHNLQSALQHYQNMLECSHALLEDTKHSKAYSRLGLTYGMLGRQHEAFINHKMALSIYEVKIERDIDICVAYKNLASSSALSGQVSEAKTYYESALAVAMETGNTTYQMDIYCKLADLHREQLYEPHVSHIYSKEMLALAINLGRRGDERLAYKGLGLDFWDMKDYEAALGWMQKELKMSQEGGNKEELMDAHNRVGATYKKLGNLAEATSHYTTALQMAQQTGDKPSEIKFSLFIGDLYREQHSPHTAIQYYEQALQLARQLGNMHKEMEAYSSLGWAHIDRGECKKALEWFQKHLKMSQDDEDEGEQITAHILMGDSYSFLGELDQAKSHFNTALQMAQQTGDQQRQMYVYREIGDMYLILHTANTAIQYHEQYLAIARQLGNRQEEGVAYNRLGLDHCQMGEYEAALEWDEKYLKMTEDNGNKKEQAVAHARLGDAYRFIGDLDQATSHFNTALQMAQQTEDQPEQMCIHCHMGNMYLEELHSPHTAIQHYEQALALARQLMDKRWEALAYNRLGLVHHEMGEYETALGWHQKYLKMSEDFGNKREQAVAHVHLGNTYRFLGELDKTTSHFNTALQMAQQTEDKYGQMGVYLSMGEMHREQLHSPHTAIQYHKQYLELARQLKNKCEEGVAYNKLALDHQKMGEYEAALEWDEKFLKITEENGIKKQQAVAHVRLGNAHRFLGELDLATSHFNTALQMAQQTGDKYGQLHCHHRMGDMHREQLHSPHTAIQYYEQCLALARQMVNRRQEGRAYKKLGKAHYEMGEYEAGLEWFQKYLKIRQECGDKTEQITAHKHIAVSYKALGKLDLARSHCQTAMDIAMETGNKQAQDYIAEVVAGL